MDLVMRITKRDDTMASAMSESKDPFEALREAIWKTAENIRTELCRQAPILSKTIAEINASIEQSQKRIDLEVKEIKERHRHGTRRTSGKEEDLPISCL